MGKSIKDTLKNYPAASPEEWFATFKERAKDIMKGAEEVTWLQYCPHKEELVQLSTDPNKNFCSECIRERLNAGE